MTLAGLAILLLFAVHIIRGWMGDGGAPEAAPLAAGSIETASEAAAATAAAVTGEGGAAPAADLSCVTLFNLPYDNNFLTQGIHGQDYGH